jgi:hypothetical protein
MHRSRSWLCASEARIASIVTTSSTTSASQARASPPEDFRVVGIGRSPRYCGGATTT